MPSQPEILVLAVNKLQQAKISNINENSPQARAMNSIWNITRQKCLRAHLWNFAVLDDTITALATPTPKMDYKYFLPLPGNCLRLIRAEPATGNVFSSTKTAYALRNAGGTVRAVASDYQSMNILFIGDITNPGLFDPSFSDYFATELAIATARGLIDVTESHMQILRDMKKETLGDAKMLDGEEDAPEELDEGTWLNERL